MRVLNFAIFYFWYFIIERGWAILWKGIPSWSMGLILVFLPWIHWFRELLSYAEYQRKMGWHSEHIACVNLEKAGSKYNRLKPFNTYLLEERKILFSSSNQPVKLQRQCRGVYFWLQNIAFWMPIQQKTHSSSVTFWRFLPDGNLISLLGNS